VGGQTRLPSWGQRTSMRPLWERTLRGDVAAMGLPNPSVTAIQGNAEPSRSTLIDQCGPCDVEGHKQPSDHDSAAGNQRVMDA